MLRARFLLATLASFVACSTSESTPPPDAGSSKDAAADASACDEPDEGRMNCGGECNVEVRADPMNCGGCGVVCGSKPCGGGACIDPIAAHQVLPSAIAFAGSNVVWATFGASGKPGGVHAIPATGGTIVELAKVNKVRALAVDASNAFYAGAGAISRVAIAGGTPNDVASGSFASIALDGDDVFALTDTDVVRVPKVGGTPSSVATISPAPYSLSVLGGAIVVSTQEESSTSTMGYVRRRAPGASLFDELAKLPKPGNVLIDGTGDDSVVYFVERDRFSLRQVPVARPSEAKVLAGGGDDKSRGAELLAVDSEYVYFARDRGHTIWRVAKSGGSAARVVDIDANANATFQIVAFAVGTSDVFFVTSGEDAAVYRAAKE